MPEETVDRFTFLYPNKHAPRYRLCPPDLLELNWTVFDFHTKQTIARGPDPVSAVDFAIGYTQHHP